MAKIDKITEFLSEWCTNYIKNKDLLIKNIEHIKKSDGKLDVKYKNKRQIFFLDPFLKNFDKMLPEMGGEDSHTLVCFNSRNNFEVILKNWKKISEFKNFNVYFVNPFSKTDKIWIISPYTHNMIADESSLELGLKTMFGQVEQITEEEAKKIVG